MNNETHYDLKTSYSDFPASLPACLHTTRATGTVFLYSLQALDDIIHGMLISFSGGPREDFEINENEMEIAKSENEMFEKNIEHKMNILLFMLVVIDLILWFRVIEWFSVPVLK